MDLGAFETTPEATQNPTSPLTTESSGVDSAISPTPDNEEV